MEHKEKTVRDIGDNSVLIVLTLMITCVISLSVAAVFDSQSSSTRSSSTRAQSQIYIIPTLIATVTPDDDFRQSPHQVDAGQGRDGVYDPQEPGIRFDFPPGAVSEAIEVKAYYTELPADVPPPPNGTLGAPFYFGAWIRGQGRTVEEFNRSIVINVNYDDGALSQLAEVQQPAQSIARAALSKLRVSTTLPLAMAVHPVMASLLPYEPLPSHYGCLSPSQEARLRLSMYDPSTQAWVKLCSRVDTHVNKVSAALLLPTPLEEGDNALFAVISDDTPVLEQVVDRRGNTTLSIPESNFRLGVLAGTVAVGTHFEVTLLPEVPESDLYRLLPMPVDIKACQADYTSVNKIQQITQFPKPMTVGFDVDADTLSRAGGQANLTIVSLQGRQWIDLEEYGCNVVRGDTTIAVDTGDLGTFSAAVR